MTQSRIEVDCNLIKKENKKGDHLIYGSRFIVKYLCDFWLCECFCCFWV